MVRGRGSCGSSVRARSWRSLATSLVAVAAATALAGPAIALGSAWGVAVGAAIAAWVLLRRGQLDGDGYGAVIELVFVALLSGIAVAGSLR